jgi:hypothetical protein
MAVYVFTSSGEFGDVACLAQFETVKHAKLYAELLCEAFGNDYNNYIEAHDVYGDENAVLETFTGLNEGCEVWIEYGDRVELLAGDEWEIIFGK